MRTLVIGDLHHQTATADEIRAAEPHDQVVFLGDYFDSFSDTPADARATALWVRARLIEPQCTLLFGNHDLPYAFDAMATGFLSCSGFENSKAQVIAAVLGKDEWRRMHAFAHVGPWLVSHAGFHRDLLAPEMVRDKNALQARCSRALEALEQHRPDPLFAAGRDRGGSQPVGGITWCDWKRFEGIAGVHQIVGHTPSKDEPLRHWSPPLNTNYCIDHLNGHVYAVVTDRCTRFKLCRGNDLDPVILDEVCHRTLQRSSALAGTSAEFS